METNQNPVQENPAQRIALELELEQPAERLYDPAEAARIVQCLTDGYFDPEYILLFGKLVGGTPHSDAMAYDLLMVVRETPEYDWIQTKRILRYKVPYSRREITYINLYDLAVSAGTGEPLGDTYYTTRVELPTEKVPENAHCCLRVSGDSMEPAYKDGDIVFVQRLENGRLREGEVGIFSLNGEGYIKQLGQRQLLSFNPKYPPIPIGPYDRLECQGRVLSKL